ncbi:MAG TPA: aminoglycoside phosphotransferase family protein [Terriglobales bacterium]|nr:aminoglycoside phosphotransferase family protein [Terriglobales bacterium]
MPVSIPPLLAKHCAKTEERRQWLEALPNSIAAVQERWGLSLAEPFDHMYVSCSWVALATLADGSRAVLKMGMPHFEAEQEMEGLQFWNGDAAVRLLASDRRRNAMLLERCEPGTPLFSIPEREQDLVITSMLRRLWKTPQQSDFRPLSALIEYWSEETRKLRDKWSDSVVNEGLQVLAALAAEPRDGVLLATDLHSGNVLRAQREPWLMIDPKPFVGDPAYDLTQHLINCEERLQTNPHDLIQRVADLAQVDADRVRLWLFGRAAAEPRDQWTNWKTDLARKLS